MSDPPPPAFLLRFAIRGTVVWAVAALLLRLIPPEYLSRPDTNYALVALASAASLSLGAVWLTRKLPSPAKLSGAAAFSAPGLLGDALLTALFPLLLPNFRAEHDATFGALMLMGYGVILLTAMAVTRRT